MFFQLRGKFINFNTRRRIRFLFHPFVLHEAEAESNVEDVEEIVISWKEKVCNLTSLYGNILIFTCEHDQNHEFNLKDEGQLFEEWSWREEQKRHRNFDEISS